MIGARDFTGGRQARRRYERRYERKCKDQDAAERDREQYRADRGENGEIVFGHAKSSDDRAKPRGIRHFVRDDCRVCHGVRAHPTSLNDHDIPPAPRRAVSPCAYSGRWGVAGDIDGISPRQFRHLGTRKGPNAGKRGRPSWGAGYYVLSASTLAGLVRITASGSAAASPHLPTALCRDRIAAHD